MISLPAIAELYSVTQRYGRIVALDDVSVAIPAGCMVGLIGPDAVGKSTLQALIAGVRRIHAGQVKVMSYDMRRRDLRRQVSEAIAYVPQGLGRSLYSSLSVYENVDFFGRLFAKSAQERHWRIERLLRTTGLHPFADRPAGKLSGGMKQKLALCCSLIHDPKILILDEPTTGIDPLSRRRFWKLIERIRSERPDLSVLTATAYMEEAENFDYLLAMQAGRVVATGTPADVKRMTHSETLEQAFVALMPKAQRAEYKPPVHSPLTVYGGYPAIEAKGLTKVFGDFVAVKNISIRIERGEIFGFVGSNGCGKTTTMKMLTGLLQPSAGVARLFGRNVEARDLSLRTRVGYMSQSFSLYNELTVRHNLALHARLFHVPEHLVPSRVDEMLTRFELSSVSNALPSRLPFGLRQRLQLAVAIIHKPEILILDEPTSGVDPVAREKFWAVLMELSRNDRVTIFVSTHFISEAELCDRVSLMHAGRILAIDTPKALQRAHNASSLEEAFIGYLEDAGEAAIAQTVGSSDFSGALLENTPSSSQIRFKSVNRVWAFARRESMELMRDPIRICFALLGPLILAVAMAYGISFDIEKARYAAPDYDKSQESQTLLEAFSGSRYFEAAPPLRSDTEVDTGLTRGDFKLAIAIPPGYGRDLLAKRFPEIGIWLDGSNTFRAETIRGYVQGVITDYLTAIASAQPSNVPGRLAASIQTRFRYNQAFLSIYAISPGVLMMLLILFSVMLTALGVVREKELGSITNFYAAPVSKVEYLIGKQLPYILVAFVSFIELLVLIRLGFQVPIAGNILILGTGAVACAAAATSFGLVLSAFVRSQIAAIFASAIIVMIPTVNFSGMIYPISTLEGGSWIIGRLFPALYFQNISVGIFDKGLGLAALWASHAALLGFYIGFLAIATFLLKKQEP